MAVVCECAVSAVGVLRFEGADNLVVTVTLVMGVGLVTEDVTIRIGSTATSGAAKRRVKTPKITRRWGLSQWSRNWELAVVSRRLVWAVIWCFMRNGNVMGVTLTCTGSCHANKSRFSA